jgi:hypothetical protein
LPERSCLVYRIHLELKIRRDRLRKLVQRYRKQSLAQLKKAGARGVRIELLTGRVAKKRLRLFHAAIVTTGGWRPIPVQSRKIAFSIVQDIVDRLAGKARADGDAMAFFVLDKKRYKLRGDFKLPISFPMAEDAVGRVGNATLRGLELAFDKSPIGLQCVELSSQEDRVLLSVQTGFYSSSMERVLHRTFSQIREIGTLFVEEKSE